MGHEMMSAERNTDHRNEVLLEVAELVGELRHRLDNHNGVLSELTASAAKFVPGAQYAGIAVIDNRMVETISATHHHVVELGDVERTQLQGPCLSAAPDDPVSRIADHPPQ